MRFAPLILLALTLGSCRISTAPATLDRTPELDKGKKHAGPPALELLYSFGAGHLVWPTSVAVAGHEVYVLDGSQVKVFDVKGKFRGEWDAVVAFGARLAADHGRVYVLDGLGMLRAFDGRGRKLWARAQFANDVAAGGGHVYVSFRGAPRGFPPYGPNGYLAVIDSDGNLLEIRNGGDRPRRVDFGEDGVVRIVDSFSRRHGSFVTNIAGDREGFTYVTLEYPGAAIYVYGPTGIELEPFPIDFQVADLDAADHDRLFAVDFTGARVVVLGTNADGKHPHEHEPAEEPAELPALVAAP